MLLQTISYGDAAHTSVVYFTSMASRSAKRHPVGSSGSGNFPPESDTGMFGGNSNWRGPIWMPVNLLILRAVINHYSYYGDNFKIECPTGSGRLMNLYLVAEEISRRLARHFVNPHLSYRALNPGTVASIYTHRVRGRL